MANNAKMIDIDTIIAMGIDPSTGLPTKISKKGTSLRQDVNKMIRVKDEQEFVNRLIVDTPGLNMTSQDFFRLMYYHSNLALFMINDKPYLMPYALEGGLDFYTRPNYIVPVPFSQTSENKDDKAAMKKILAQYKSKVAYDVMLPDEIDPKEHYAVILNDYTPQRSGCIPRAQLDDAICGFEADLFQYMRTSTLMGSGIKAMRVADPDAANGVLSAANAINDAALAGQPFIPMLSRAEFQELTGAGALHMQDYMLAIQGIDNFRKQCLGVDNAAMFDKKAYVNEAQTNTGAVNSLPLIDSLMQIQNKFDI